VSNTSKRKPSKYKSQRKALPHHHHYRQPEAAVEGLERKDGIIGRGVDLPIKFAILLKYAVAVKIKHLRTFRTVVGDADGVYRLSDSVNREGHVERATGTRFQLGAAIIGLGIITVGTRDRDNLDRRDFHCLRAGIGHISRIRASD